LNTYLPGSFLPEGMRQNQVASYQEFNKLATQYAAEQARRLGAREAASVVQMMVNANPNAEMTPETLRRMMAGMRAMNDYAKAKADAADTYRAQNGRSLEGFERQWNRRPEQFLLPHLRPEDIRNIPTSVLERMQ
jgi:hypothetical protein